MATARTKLKLSSDPAHQIAADVLVVPVLEGELGRRNKGAALEAALEALGKTLTGAARQEGFEGRAGQRLSLHTHGTLGASRLYLVGLGEAGEGLIPAFHDGVGDAARTARGLGAGHLAIALPEATAAGAASLAGAAAEAALLGSYRFDRYLSDDPDRPRRAPIKTVTLATDQVDADVRTEVRIAEAVAEATCDARDMVNEPAGALRPVDLSKYAKDLAKAHGLKCTVRGASEIEKLKMGMFRGVSLGADTEPQLITLEYKPKGRAKGKGIAFVGKGITFDSGGYDLKPAQFMDGMKMDMGGAAATLAAMRAVAAIKPPFPVTAYVGACENLINGRAYKPGDVLKSRKGLTVEINNTDAEGRLVLGDVLTWAVEQGHEAVVDLATLTGACMIALGPYTVGAFSNDEAWVGSVLDAAKAAGEHVWQLPLNPNLREHLKSDIADMKNTGERAGGAISAALFLSSFVGETPWVHLDIAGPAMYGRDKGAVPKGASGVGVRTLARLVRDRAAG
jgi:leucyl aminopeptidase